MDLTKLKIGQKVMLNTRNKSWLTKVTRITKTKIIVESPNKLVHHEHWFRKKDGSDMGPSTAGVYFLSEY